MQLNKFTQNSLQAINDAESLVYEFGQQQIDQEHLLLAMLRLEDSLILKLIEKMGIQPTLFADEVEGA
ncbi:MAG: hypothetical protein K6F13_07100, partial [Lachnospiraceae bacterium]|nr:hypothetical protein [Lachnospiraceae bacterium]